MRWAFAVYAVVIWFAVAAWAEGPPFSGVVTGDRVNVRAGPSTNYEILCVLQRGDTVGVRDRRGDWYVIDPPRGAQAWMAAEYLDVAGAVPTEEAWKRASALERGALAAAVAASHLRVRARPLLRSSVIGRLDRGDRVAVLYVKDGWARVAPAGDVRAFIHADYVRACGEYTPPEPLLPTEVKQSPPADRRAITAGGSGGASAVDARSRLAAIEDDYARAVRTGRLRSELPGLLRRLRALVMEAPEPVSTLAAVRLNELIVEHPNMWDAAQGGPAANSTGIEANELGR